MLRRELRARRLAFEGDASAIDRLLAPLLAREGPIAGYMAHRGEPDVLPFLMRAFHLGHAVALPRPGNETLDFIRWHPDIVMQAGLAGIDEPVGGEPIVPTIMLTPLVGFDRAGHRLGQGGGYYDRWFARHPDAMRIGIAWSVQEVEALTPEPWDMPLQAIVTEKEWIAP
jgi:5-formyltetrahydrofolate cyclo-ligase